MSQLDPVIDSPSLDRLVLNAGAPLPLASLPDLLSEMTCDDESSVVRHRVRTKKHNITAQKFTLSAPYAIIENRLVLVYPEGFQQSFLRGASAMSRDLARSLAISYLRNTLDCLVQIDDVNPACFSPGVIVSDLYHPYAKTKKKDIMSYVFTLQ